MISFCCNDYLGFSQHELVKRAATQAIVKYGAGAGASRLVTGNHPLLEDLEARLAALKGTEAAAIFGSGYLNQFGGVIPSFAGPEDLILIDELAHACLFAGARLSGAAMEIFHHNDVGHARNILSAERSEMRHALILTDGVFSMDGDLAPLPELSELASEFDAWLMTDDAHGVGDMGEGRGSSFVWGPDQARVNVPLQMGTLSKAIGSYGGYLCASVPGHRSGQDPRTVPDLFNGPCRPPPRRRPWQLLISLRPIQSFCAFAASEGASICRAAWLARASIAHCASFLRCGGGRDGCLSDFGGSRISCHRYSSADSS